ncbi:hypothetical protein AB0D90_15620 [Streptomyces althioticus]|uniref:hypothetical protein n=1 Tax=Streptomyces althioticus TaxID=83380 RepID=UPI0034014A9E
MGEPNKPAAVVALARGATAEQAAREAGVSGRTVRRWMEDPDFQVDVQDARTELLSATVQHLAMGAAESVATLRQLLSHKDGRVQVQAARTMLDSYLEMYEMHNLDRRIRELENAERGEDW